MHTIFVESRTSIHSLVEWVMTIHYLFIHCLVEWTCSELFPALVGPLHAFPASLSSLYNFVRGFFFLCSGPLGSSWCLLIHARLSWRMLTDAGSYWCMLVLCWAQCRECWSYAFPNIEGCGLYAGSLLCSNEWRVCWLFLDYFTATMAKVLWVFLYKISTSSFSMFFFPIVDLWHGNNWSQLWTPDVCL
jgi:hypothetical protein